MSPTRKCINHLLASDPVFRDNWPVRNANETIRREVERKLIQNACHRQNIHIRDFVDRFENRPLNCLPL